MTLKQRVERQLSLKPNSEELLALWERIWTAYSNGGSRCVDIALDELREDIATAKENECGAGV